MNSTNARPRQAHLPTDAALVRLGSRRTTIEELRSGDGDALGPDACSVTLRVSECVPDRHQIGLDPQQALVGQVVPARTRRRLNTQRACCTNRVDLVRRRIDERRHDHDVGVVGVEETL